MKAFKINLKFGQLMTKEPKVVVDYSCSVQVCFVAKAAQEKGNSPYICKDWHRMPCDNL